MSVLTPFQPSEIFNSSILSFLWGCSPCARIQMAASSVMSFSGSPVSLLKILLHHSAMVLHFVDSTVSQELKATPPAATSVQMSKCFALVRVLAPSRCLENDQDVLLLQLSQKLGKCASEVLWAVCLCLWSRTLASLCGFEASLQMAVKMSKNKLSTLKKLHVVC